MPDASFKDFVVDQLSDVEDIRTRRMFGSFGLYAGDTFFAIVSGDVLYFKTNDKTRQKYVAAGADCFRPSEKQILKNYYEVPADILEDRELLVKWAREAIGISA